MKLKKKQWIKYKRDQKTRKKKRETKKKRNNQV